jgi:integrase
MKIWYSACTMVNLINQTISSHYWMKLVKRADLEGVRLHDARHTMATIMLEQGIHPKIVQERLGHANISTTLDTYSHVIPGLQAAAAIKLDDIFKPKETKLEKEVNAIIQK